MLRTISLISLLCLAFFRAGFLRAQTPDTIPPDQNDLVVQAALAAKNPDQLEKLAADLEAQRLYDPALKLLSAALSIRGQVSGEQSAEYGLLLLRLGWLEHKLIHTKEAADYYSRAVQLLPGRPETANAFLYLGIAAKDQKRSMDYLQRAQSLDASLTGPVLMWTALIYERLDQPEEAETRYKAALAAENPDSREARETLTLYARFLKEQGRENVAAAVRARAEALAPRLNEPTTLGAPASAPPTYRIGGGVTQPVVVYKIDPPYSEEARFAKVSGTVLLKVVVGADGLPHDITVARGFGFGLDDCAVASVAKWRFKPGQKDGTAVAVHANIEVNFRLL